MSEFSEWVKTNRSKRCVDELLHQFTLQAAVMSNTLQQVHMFNWAQKGQISREQENVMENLQIDLKDVICSIDDLLDRNTKALLAMDEKKDLKSLLDQFQVPIEVPLENDADPYPFYPEKHLIE